MSDDLASAVERFDAIVAAMDAEIDECYPEPEARAEMRDRWTVTRPIQLSDLRLILSALKDATEALEPMALSANRYDPEPREIIGDGVRLVSIISALDKLTVGDLRRARAILEKLRG